MGAGDESTSIMWQVNARIARDVTDLGTLTGRSALPEGPRARRADRRAVDEFPAATRSNHSSVVAACDRGADGDMSSGGAQCVAQRSGDDPARGR
jgi:hypothetical protein